MELDTSIISDKICQIRGQAVILDSDLAEVYGITTTALNQAVARNKGRFPARFTFALSREELMNLMSQNVIASLRHGGRRKPPRVFTEHGALMASSVLRTKKATTMSVFIIEAFVKLREAMRMNHEILRRLAEIDKSLLSHDQALYDIYTQLLPLMESRGTEPGPQRRMGFNAD
jgi:hypothetical protein